ncbi:MAG: DUF2207 domain-containing protein, partial [Candidatus Melainabacteria bacterium]|nr:DUF2207 domain-containing protein [Candidatus Melainabacteria bacterium]
MQIRFQEARLSRVFTLILLVVLGWAASSNCAAHADAVTVFTSNIEVLPDASLEVHEDLTVRFDTPNRHGINRFIPVVYDRHGNNYSVDFKLLGVTTADGKYVPFHASRQGRDFYIKIGDPKKTIMGLHQYHIHYTVRRAINFFNNAPEVYWNVTGDEWHMPIDKVVAQVVFPSVADKSELRAKSFIGQEGSTQSSPYALEPNRATFTCGRLQPAEGLTVVLGLPEGLITKPTQWQEFL